MNLNCCKNLLVLKEEELKGCNGGAILITELQPKMPPIVIDMPFPDGEHRL